MESKKYTAETITKAKAFREKQGLTYNEISKLINVPDTTIRTWATTQSWSQPALIDSEVIGDPTDPNMQRIEELERKLQGAKADHKRLDVIHRTLQSKYETLSESVGMAETIGLPVLEPIKKKKPSGKTEATAVIVASDWHLEEQVKPESVNMLNEYNLDIAEKRAKKFFQSGLRLTEIINRDVNITTVLMPLLGDFITNDIHEEFRETNQLLPMEAIELAQNLIASGINFILEHSEYNLVLPCHVGNHTRTTKQVFASTEHGHSLEYFMYKNLEMLFGGNKRVKFEIVPAYHSYLPVYDLTLRFHHGHGLRYHGGVGGLYIPVNKAIAQWNKAKKADLDVFAHWHQMRDGGNWICNSSLIGYNPYAIRIKADYEPPRQTFFIIDSKRGRTFTCPIVVTD